MASAYTIVLAWIAGALFGFAVAVIANFTLADRLTLGILILAMSGFVCSALVCGLYIFKLPQEDEF